MIDTGRFGSQSINKTSRRFPVMRIWSELADLYWRYDEVLFSLVRISITFSADLGRFNISTRAISGLPPLGDENPAPRVFEAALAGCVDIESGDPQAGINVREVIASIPMISNFAVVLSHF